MNWKQRYEEIQVGDKVQCIDFDKNETRQHTKGYGWELGHIFTVTKYCKGINTCGVFEDCIQKVS